jgi:carbon-monoxide dehydrogenase small subunit
MEVGLSFRLNGQEISLQTPSNRLLVDLLRYDLQMTGTKEGCGMGVCGLCTVLLDGEPISACITLALMVDGAELTTIEGIATDGTLHRVQEAFIAHGGYQCGICTPGQVVAAKALLDHNPHPTEDEVREWMMGNLCRCTGYYQIIDSIKAAAAATP